MQPIRLMEPMERIQLFQIEEVSKLLEAYSGSIRSILTPDS